MGTKKAWSAIMSCLWLPEVSDCPLVEAKCWIRLIMKARPFLQNNNRTNWMIRTVLTFQNSNENFQLQLIKTIHHCCPPRICGECLLGIFYFLSQLLDIISWYAKMQKCLHFACLSEKHNIHNWLQWCTWIHEYEMHWGSFHTGPFSLSFTSCFSVITARFWTVRTISWLSH